MAIRHSTASDVRLSEEGRAAWDADHEGDASDLEFTQSGSGAVSQNVQVALRDMRIVPVTQFGAACDDSTDDTAAVQAACDSIGDDSGTIFRSGVVILIPGPCVISDTIVLRRKSIIFAGLGWGHRIDTSQSRRSYLRWNGSVGSPMVRIADSSGGTMIRDLRFVGKSSAKPSCAISLYETDPADGSANHAISIENVMIGPWGNESDTGDHFTNAILAEGDNTNNSEVWINRLYVDSVSGSAIKQGCIQNLNWTLDNISIVRAGNAVEVHGSVTGTNWQFSQNDVDLYVPQTDDSGTTIGAQITVQNFYSELAGRLADFQGTTRCQLYGGFFQITSSLNVDGNVVTSPNSRGLYLGLHNFRFAEASSPPAAAKISARAAAAGAIEKSIVLDGITGWSAMSGGTNGLDIALRGPTDRRYIYFREIPQSASASPVRMAQNFLQGTTGLDWDINRYDLPALTGTQQVKLYDDFLGDVLSDEWGGQVGSDPQCVTPTIVSAVGGAVRLTTGDDAGATMALNGVQLESGLNWQANANALVMEVRLRMSAIFSVCVYVGFTDQIGTLEMPIHSAASADTITTNSTDAVGVMFDTAMSTDNWWLVGVANNTDATAQNSALAPSANTFETWRIEVDRTGIATFYRNGVAVGTAMTGAVTATVPLTPVVAAFARSTTGKTVDVDYIYVTQQRA